MSARPICAASGQLGRSSSSWPPLGPVLDLAAAIPTSRQNGMLASLPITPVGIFSEKRLNSCSPSSRVRRTFSGEYRPAALFSVPATKLGLNGSPPLGQGPPLTPWSTVNELVLVTISFGWGLSGSAAFQGVNFAVMS